MKRITLFCLVFLLGYTSYAQLELLKFDNSLRKWKTKVRNIVPIVNKKNNDINLLFIDKYRIYSYLINEKFTVINSLATEKKRSNYTTIIGNSISENNDYKIFLTDGSSRKFIAVNLSYKNKTTTTTAINLDLGKERFLQSVNINNKFYILSSLKKTSTLFIYKFNDDLTYEKRTIDLSNYRFVNDFGKNDFFSLLTADSGSSKIINIKKFEENTPNSLESTSDYSKLFVRKNKLVFTFDHNKSYTQIITIDLDTYDHQFKVIKKPVLFKDVFFIKKSNTFIHEDKIYQLASSTEEMVFEIKDFKTEELIKSYKVLKMDSILFKNSPIIQKGGAYENYREFEKTKKYLRKLSYSDVGISVYSGKDNYYVTLGGNKEIAQGGGGMMMGGFGGIPMGSFGGSVTVFFNPTMFAYNSYTRTKSTFINCKFDSEFNHVKGKIKKNPFDIITQFKKQKYLPRTGETVFKYKDYYILGHYFPGDKKYHLTKFE